MVTTWQSPLTIREGIAAGQVAARKPFAELSDAQYRSDVRLEAIAVFRKQDALAHRGLSLHRSVLRRLSTVGIFVQSQVSLEYQHLGQRYVVRGIESGGAVREIGRYITFCGPWGEQLPYLHPIDSVAVNGVHAVVIAPVLVRVELFRTGRTCQILITRHEPGQAESGKRPPLASRVLFRGVNGFLHSGRPLESIYSASSDIPRFWSRSGEERKVPSVFAQAIQAATRGATCVGCSHAHFLAGSSIVCSATLGCCSITQPQRLL